MAHIKDIELRLKTISDFSDVTDGVDKVQRVLNKLKLPADMKKNFSGIFTELTNETTKYQRLLDSGFKKKSDVTGLEASGARINKLLTKLSADMRKIDPSILQKSFQVDPTALDKLTQKMAEVQSRLSQSLGTDQFKTLKDEANAAAGAMSKLSKTKFTSSFSEAFKKGDIQGAAEAIRQLEANHKTFTSTLEDGTSKEDAFKAALDRMKAAVAGLGQVPGLENINAEIKELDTQMDQLEASQLEQFIQTFAQGQTAVEGMTQETGRLTTSLNQTAQSTNSFGSQLDQLKGQISHFFGLTNAVFLFRRALQQALQTVTELDEAMTQTAVVTDMSVGDMWEKLPQYTEEANKLGVAVKDLYEATTLYYQQGLKGQAVMDVGVETMKMAAIAGMDASDATQAMTAALRGFNMEVNQMNATRVNDVYSQLAAISASDTGQIATAMSKTASIAASANMEFENTAALLAQIIETTQEAPETAGTALKTIIARFSEVKSLREKGQTSGQDEEGESIDVNKIDKALKQVGISMNAFFAGTEGLDDVLLRLAEKWNTLDFETQRYIATTAAGSRQQSRFMAMMSDYERTLELTGAAADSAGASQAQFEKTMESLEYKVNQLKNSWAQFTMGIADNQLIKAGVDALGWLLDKITAVTSSLPGMAEGMANIMLAFGALQLGKGVFNALFTSMSSQFSAAGKTAGISFRKALSQEFGGIKTLFSKNAWRLPPLKTDQQAAALAKLTAAETAYATSAKGAAAATTTQSAGAAGAIAAEKAHAAALNEVALAYGLNESQMIAFNGLRAAGLAADTAAIAAANGLTTAKYNEMVASAVMLGLGEEETKQKVEEMVATYNAIAAKNAENAVDKLSVTQQLGLIATAMFGNKAKKEEIRTRLAATGAKGAETGATWALAIAEYAAMIPAGLMLVIILLIIAAVALLVIGIMALVKAMKNNTPEAKMKALEEATEKAAEAAKEAKEAYEGALEAQDGYEDMVATLDKLTVGTTAWKEQLMKVNDQVLELLEKYPLLDAYMNGDGQLVITDESWAALQSSLESQMRTTAMREGMARANQSTQATINNLQTTSSHDSRSVVAFDGTGLIKDEKSLSNLYSDITNLKKTNPEAFKTSKSTTDKSGYTYTKNYSTGTGQYATSYSKTYTSSQMPTDGTYTVYSQELKDLAEKYGVTANDLYNNLDEIEQGMAEYANVLNTYISQAGSKELRTSRYNAGITSAVAATTDLSALKDAKAEEWAKVYKTSGKNNQKAKTELTDKVNKYNAEHRTNIQSTGKENAVMKAYLKELTGEEFDTSGYKNKDIDEALAKAIQEAEIAQGINDTLDELYDLSTKYEEIGDLFAGGLDGSKTLEELLKDAGGADIDADVKKAIEEQYKKMEQKRKDLDARTKKVFGMTAKDFAGAYDATAKYFEMYDTILTSAGEGAAQVFENAFKGLKPEKVTELAQELDGVDWSSSIQGAKALWKMLETGSDEAKKLAASMFAVSPAMYSVTAQVNELYGILGTETLSELAEDGEITADEILKLGDACESVGDVMDTTGISAATLGKYYTKLQKGTLSIADSSGNFVKVLHKLSAAANTVEDSFAAIDTFDPARSWTEIGTSVQDMYGTMNELYEKGAYGDEQLIDYVKWFIGEENWGELIRKKGGDYKAAMDEVFGYLPENGENMYQTWKKFAQLDTSGMVSLGANGSIDFSMEAIGSVDQLKEQLMSTLDISEELADAMIADAQTFSDKLRTNLKRLSIEDAFTEWLSSAISLNGTKIITEQQLQVFAEELGIIPEKLKEFLESKEVQAQIPVKVATYLTEDKKLTQEGLDFIKEMATSIGEDGESVFNFDLAYQMMLEVGLDDAAAKQELETMSKSFEGMKVIANGKSLKILQGGMTQSVSDGTETGQIAGIIQGLTSDAVKTAQELSALQQGKMMADAVAKAMIIGANASKIANSKDNWWTNFWGTSKSKREEEQQGVLDYASGAIGGQYNDDITNKEDQLKGMTGGSGDNSSSSTSLTDLFQDWMKSQGYDSASDSSAYGPNSQTTANDGSKDNVTPWENDYDKYYNNVKKINAELRKREKLELEYERILNRNATTADALLKNRRKQLASLEKEKKLRETMLSNRMDEMDDIQSENADLGKYAWYDKDLGQVQIDWAELEKLNGSTDEELTKRVEEFISRLEDQSDLIEEEQDGLDEINDGVWSIYEQGKDSYFDLEDRVKEAIISTRQDEIDTLTEINDSLTDLNTSLLDALQKQVDDYRQMRDNERMEEDIADKQQQLAYLQQDTSGANQLEIMRLQEEIDADVEDYTDTLVDQKISELQDQNDAAAEQRQYQIDLMQAQLDNYAESQEIWSEVHDLMSTGLSKVDGLVQGSALEALLKSADRFDDLSKLGQMEWMKTVNSNTAEALSWLQLGATQSLLSEGQTVTFKDKNGKEITGKVDKDGNIVTDDGVYKADSLSMDMYGNITSSMAIAPKAKTPAAPASTPTPAPSTPAKPTPTANEKKGVSAAIWNGNQGWGSGSTRKARLKEVFGEGNDVQANYVNNKITSGYTGKMTDYSYDKMKAKYAYSTGGLADFTGPAWLDGTKSKPEYVLNAKQTQAFLQLVDVLSDLHIMSSKTQSTENHGDNVYDIDINVESIGNDYDVEQMADAIKRLIDEDARYRNNNAISLMR